MKEKLSKIAKKEILAPVGLIIFAFVLIAVCVNIGKSSNTVTEDTAKTDKSNITSSVSVLEERLKDMQTLVTERYDFTFVEDYMKSKTILWIFNVDSEFSYSYDGYVTAGIDLSQISITTDDTSRKIIVTYPEATIQQVEIDYNSFKKYKEKEGFTNPIKISDYNEAQKEFTETAKERAIEKGIIEQANSNAEYTLENLLKLSLGSDYTFVFEKK